MKYKKIVSFICLTAIFSQNIPFDLLSYANEINKIEKMENIKEESDSTKEDKSSDTKVDTDETTIKTEESKDTHVEEKKVSIEEYTFNAYIDGENELAFSLGFDTKEGKFIVKDRSDKELSNKNPDSIIYKINVYDKESKEKIAIELTGKDKGISDKLDILNESKYEIGDFIQIIPINNKEGLKITGDIQGDINKEKEDYSDGIDEPDYIQNVRFEITEEGLKSVYNEAPVIHGLSDIKDVNDKNIDILEGISVTDDHDKEIDTSTIQTEVKQIDELSAEITYTATDSWGRKSSGSRIISGINPNDYIGTSFSNKNSANSSLKDVLITVGGVTYSGGQDTRFKLKFDIPSSSIKVIEPDSRVMNNRVDGEYFKFELYDKDMNLKKSVTLLGKDKSNSDKVKELNNLKYVIGDHIYIWHKESSTKLKIAGNIENSTTENVENSTVSNTLDYSNGVAEENLINHRFEITSKGLKSIKNEAPQITGLDPVAVERGGKIEYWPESVRITDDKDEFKDETVKSGKVSVHHTEVDTSKLGEHKIIYTVTDSWGLSTQAERRVTVSGTNPIESKFIEVYNKQNELAFKIGFDSVSKTYIIREPKEGTQLNPDTDNIVFKFRVFSENGMLKKTVNIKGRNQINKRILSKIDGFKYDEGDYIELWSEDSKNGIKIIGEIGNTKPGNSGSENPGTGNENSGDAESDNTESINLENENADNNQNVDPSNGIPENYGDGIDNPDYMNNVRFKILPNSLEAVYNKAPEISFDTMTVKRGEEVNYLEGVTVRDDHDTDTEALKAKVTYKKINTNTIGAKSIEYRLTDSWGRSTVKERNITVTDKTALEANKINVKSNNGVIFSLGFDSITKKYIVTDINLNNLPDNVNGDVFKMTVYTKNTTKTNANGDFSVKHDEIVITEEDLQNKKFVSKFNNLTFADNDYISLWSYDHQNGIEVKLNKNNKSSENNEDNTYTFESDEKMYNTRFKINESSGLEKIYNAAPVIKGVDTDFYILKGSNIDLESVATVTDELDDDNEITGKLVKEGINSVDKTTVGTYPVHYEVSDSWGRTTSKDVNMHVISNSVSNDIEFYDANNNDQKIFSLKYNPMQNRFDVHKTNTETTVATNTDDTSTEDTDNYAIVNDKVFGLTVFNKNSKEIHNIELNESDVQNIDKLNEILNFDVQDGYYFSVWSNTPNRIKIQGNLIRSNSTAKEEDYTDGINDADQMINVRFKITEVGLEHIYNDSPTINGIGDLEAYAGDPIDYLEGITVSDTLDGTIDKAKVKITNCSDEPLDNVNDEGKLIIGENIIKYTVEDSWGRTTTRQITLNIKNGMKKHSIRLQGGPNENTHEDRLTMTFDTEAKKIKLAQEDQFFNQEIGNRWYFRILIFNADGRTKVDTGDITGNEKATSDKFNRLKDYVFEYGEKIEIRAWHPIRVKIDGKVIDARENYEDGFDIPMNLSNVKFEITPSGLKSIYTETVKPINGQTNIFAPIAPEGYPFQYAVVPGADSVTDGGKIKLVKTNAYSIWYEKGNDDVMKIAVYSKDGVVKQEQIYRGRPENGNNSAWHFQDFTYKNGDYLFLQHMDPKRLAIYGNVINSKEDYSDGFEEVIDMRNTIFKFTQNGLEAVYNEAPVINATEEKIVYLGENFDPLNDVTVTDDKDGNGTIRPTVNVSEYRNEVGEYNIEYTAVDSWRRTTTKTRKIIVVPKIYDNRFKIYSDSDSDGNLDTGINATNTADGGDSSDNQNDIENITDEPIFEIGFDPLNNKYKVYNQKADRLSVRNLDDTAFDIEIRNEQGDRKAKVTITGNDRGTSPKLDVINETSYQNGDTIQVYRRDHQNGIKITGTIEDTNDKTTEDYSDGITNSDYMNNVRFTVKADKLETVYNEAAQITGGSTNTTIIKGNTIDLLANISVSDDKDTTLSPSDIDIYLNGEEINRNYTFDRVGKYKLHFMLVDSWGRATLIEVDISVESKVKLNDINVYDNNVLGLKIGFDTAQSKIIVKEPSITDTNTVKSSNNDTVHFKMTVRDKKGLEKYSIALNGDREHDRTELAKIHQQDYSKYDTISLKGVNPSDVRITGDIVGNTINYANGFGDTNKYTQVRFMITDDGLKELKASVPTLTGIEEVSIKRGDDIDFMDGVHANTDDLSDEDYTITVEDNNFNNMLEGTYIVNYKVTTNRGVEATYDRTVIVEPRNELEAVKLKINKGSTRSSENILTIGFDTITNKLRVINHSTTDVMPGSSSEVALRLTAYNELGSNIANIELLGGSTINEEFVSRVNAFDYQEGYSLSVWYTDYQNVVIEGNIESNTENNKANYSQGVTNADQIQHVRFTIKEDGLKSVYNNAPVITGHNEALVYYKGQILDPFKGITITDDHDNNISTHDIVYDDTKVDLDEPGSYTMKYIVEDSWGRTAEFTRTIIVKSGLGLNKIEIHSLNNTTSRMKRNTTNSKVFDIGFNDGRVKIENKSNLQLDSTKPNDNVVTIKVYDKSMNPVKEVRLNGNDTGNSSKLNVLEDYAIKEEDFISIENISSDFAKRGVKITGDVLDEKENYSDGIDTMDNIENVRFKSTEFGLQSVYNEAPTITFERELYALLGDGYDEIDFTKDATIKDDHDILGEDNIQVTGLEGVNEPGKYVLSYTVTDLWGRSYSTNRNINLSNALPNDKIEFMGHRPGRPENESEVALYMEFNTDNMTIKVPNGEDMYFRQQNKQNKQYEVTLLDNNNREIRSEHVKGEQKANDPNIGLKELDGQRFEYGYKLKFYAWHQDLLRIQGPVRGAIEDYSDGVQQGDAYTNVTFEITKSGLKSIYEKEQSLEGDKINTILPSAREGYPFKIKIDSNSRNILAHSGKPYSIEYGTDETALEIILYNQDGSIKRRLNMTGNQDPVKNSYAANELNGPFDYGDYLTIYHRTPKNLSIKGNIINQKEDYSDGIDDEDYMTHVAFKLTRDGMKSIYMEPPTIDGVVDKVFLKGAKFTNEELKSNVTATDTAGESLTNRIKINHNIDTSNVGLYDVIYSVTDDNDVSTTVTSTVQVQAKPEIYVKRGRETIELNSLTNLTEEELDARLKDVVTVIDEEDDELNKPVKLELVYDRKTMIDSTQLGGTSTVRYRATDSDGNETEKYVVVTIIRTINVSVPTVIPFQVVTNLKKKENEKEADPFVSGVLKLKNNNTSPVQVSLKSFNKQNDSGDLELVNPNTSDINWETLSSDETIRKMALGMYHKSGLDNPQSVISSKENPLWLTDGMNTEQLLGILPSAVKISEPYEAKLTFTSKHGKNFKGGTSRGKFDLIFKFE